MKNRRTQNSNLRAGLVQFQEMQTEFGKIKAEFESIHPETLKADLVTLQSEFTNLSNENAQLKEQNNRYLEENRKLYDKSNEVGFELEQTKFKMKKVQEELGLYQNMTAYQNSAIQVAYPFLKRLATRILATSAVKNALGLFEDYKEHSEKEALEIMKLHMPGTPISSKCEVENVI